MAHATDHNAPKLSARARRALDVLADGGFMVERLETNWHGGSTWMTRFCRTRSASTAVRGIGIATKYELQNAGFRFRTVSDRSAVATYYQIATD